MIIVDDVRAQVVRLASFLHLNGELAETRFNHYDGNYRRFVDLDVRIDDDERKGNVATAMRELAIYLVGNTELIETECNFDRLMKFYGIWQTNGFIVLNETKNAEVGAAIYILCSAFNHSCRPNAVRVMDESFRMQVRCINPMTYKDKTTITFMAGVRSKPERLVTLQQRYLIQCKCSLCEEEEKADNIDYNAFKEFKQRFDAETMCTANQLITIVSIISDMEKLFFRFDERITIMYIEAIDKIAETPIGLFGSMVTLSVMVKFARQAEENIRHTFGVEHYEYKRFMEKIAAIPGFPAIQFNRDEGASTSDK